MCLYIIIQKGSWNPNNSDTVNKNSVKVIRKKFKSIKNQKSDKTPKKPEWLKEWTISKGWVHNKSHMLELGIKNMEEVRREDITNYEQLSETDSSVSVENIDDLISDTDNKINLDQAEEISNSSKESESALKLNQMRELESISMIFNQTCKNYREHFPECSKKCDELSLPQIYKERLLCKEDNMLLGIFKRFKDKRKKNVSSDSCKYTVNQIFDADDMPSVATNNEKEAASKFKRNSLGRNIALFNTMNDKTNLHEEPIYECSDENSNYTSMNNYVYLNPLYSHTVQNYDTLQENNKQVAVFNRHLQSTNVVRSKSRLKQEKYVIRHVRLRIMLSLRMGKMTKTKKKKLKNEKGWLKRSEGDRVAIKGQEVNYHAARIHEMQRRIGNGKSSIKIQNMRYVKYCVSVPY